MKLHAASYKWLAMRARWRGYSLRQRAARLMQHFKNFWSYDGLDRSVSPFRGKPVGYLLDLFFFLLDIFWIGELYETVSEWLKYRTRALDAREREIVHTLFGDAVDVDRIRIDEAALTAAWSRATYVGIYTINSNGPMSEDLFVHELIHIWQYARLGSVYIPRALRAQRSPEGYNYGGVIELGLGDAEWMAYNYEQQGDILADYWRARHGRTTRWDDGLVGVDSFMPFVEKLKSEGST